MASGKMVLWNTTKAFGQPKNVTLYGKTIQPGRSRQVDANWVHRYPHVLQRAITSREVYMGSVLPQWYHKALEEKKMKRVKNTTDKPVTLQAKGKDPVLLKPGEHCTAPDEMADEMAEACEEDLEVEKLDEESKKKEAEPPPPEDPPAEEEDESSDEPKDESSDEPKDEASDEEKVESAPMSAKEAAKSRTKGRNKKKK